MERLAEQRDASLVVGVIRILEGVEELIVVARPPASLGWGGTFPVDDAWMARRAVDGPDALDGDVYDPVLAERELEARSLAGRQRFALIELQAQRATKRRQIGRLSIAISDGTAQPIAFAIAFAIAASVGSPRISTRRQTGGLSPSI